MPVITEKMKSSAGDAPFLVVMYGWFNDREYFIPAKSRAHAHEIISHMEQREGQSFRRIVNMRL